MALSKDSQLAEIVARMEARDEARDAQIRLKDKQIGALIDKLTAMLTTRGSDTYNSDRNNKQERDEDGGGGDVAKPVPAYNLKYKAIDGGGERINHKSIRLNLEWSKHHQQTWAQSKLYDDNYEQWKTDQENWKAWVAGGTEAPGNPPWRQREQRSKRSWTP